MIKLYPFASVLSAVTALKHVCILIFHLLNKTHFLLLVPYVICESNVSTNVRYEVSHCYGRYSYFYVASKDYLHLCFWILIR